MSRKIAPLIDIVRLEDKESKLKAFIRTVVEQATVHSDSTASDQTVLLIARSVDSPVAKAVAALVSEGTITVPVKTIFALVPTHDAETGGVSETLAALVRTHSGRILRDARLFDAHEQLVLGPAASWIGDCMRRDPMKRDAYECFAADCSKTAVWARTSFTRLWNICEQLPDELLQPIVISDAEAHLAAVVEEGAADPARTPSG